MQVKTKTEYIISLNHKEMIMLKRIIVLVPALPGWGVDIPEEMEEFALDILENIK